MSTSMRDKIAERLMQHYAEGGPWDGFMEADIVLDALSEPTASMIFYGMDAMARDDLEPTEAEFRLGFQWAIKAAKGEMFQRAKEQSNAS